MRLKVTAAHARRSSITCSEHARSGRLVGRMGQDLFDPPNVGGWPDGRAWIHSRSMIARANYAVAMVSDRNVGRSVPYDATELPRKYGFGSDADSVLTFHHRLLFGTDPPGDLRRRVFGWISPRWFPPYCRRQRPSLFSGGSQNRAVPRTAAKRHGAARRNIFMLTRREFLKDCSLLALSPTVPLFVAQTAQALSADKRPAHHRRRAARRRQ